MAKTNKTQPVQGGLWDAADIGGNNESADVKLQISAHDKTELTKNQQAFNRLTRQIEKLEKEIESDTQRFDLLTDLYTDEVAGLELKTAQSQIDLAFAFDAATAKIKFTQPQAKSIRRCIICILDMAFTVTVPTPEQEALYDKWSESTYKEEIERQESEESSTFRDMFEAFFGNHLRDEDGNPIDFEELQNGMFEGAGAKKPKPKNKTKRQLELEEAQRIEQEQTNKSVRSIYISLAKVLHPDSETDPALKHSKEQVMKQVTVAYEQKDLKQLLKLEMEWVHQTTDHLDQLSDDKLKSYIAVLKEQVGQLKNEKYNLRHNPRYNSIQDLLFVTEKQALKHIQMQKQMCIKTIDQIEDLSGTLSKTSSKADVVKIAKDFVMAINIFDGMHGGNDFFF